MSLSAIMGIALAGFVSVVGVMLIYSFLRYRRKSTKVVQHAGASGYKAFNKRQIEIKAVNTGAYSHQISNFEEHQPRELRDFEDGQISQTNLLIQPPLRMEILNNRQGNYSASRIYYGS
ncbi:MAG: hypothetical protein GX452_10730 [Ignavibacteriales bacterium]|jgi:hypothetical protein|nr:hypothetical protein [Ignavibacteriaceae bacterium]NLH61867.1 hypothetical protein [Ignavibacteriales bacterium]HOJ17930.1 hypothetical protein [Ignavibacteriaceae bacterium]HPO54963.1 hypothetical protein [Ignavibacteriaceae bacterium]